MTVTTKTDPRYDKIVEFLKSGGTITTGVHGTEGAATYDDGPSIAEIASAAEFGLGQLQRSWLREWFDSNRSEVEAQLGKQLRKAMSEGKSFEWAAKRVALWIQADIQKRIVQGISPANAEITILNKGASTPLVDNGLFKAAIVSYFEGSKVS